jgi:ADP-heptose:LPS heptosyltransferase
LRKNKSGRKLYVDKTKSVLFFRNDDKIGNITVSILFFRKTKKRYLYIEIMTFCDKDNKETIRYNNNVSRIYGTGKSLLRILPFSENCGNRM